MSLHVRAAFKPVRTLRQMLMKDKAPVVKEKGHVCDSCKECSKAYNESKRTLWDTILGQKHCHNLKFLACLHERSRCKYRRFTQLQDGGSILTYTHQFSVNGHHVKV